MLKADIAENNCFTTFPLLTSLSFSLFITYPLLFKYYSHFGRMRGDQHPFIPFVNILFFAIIALGK